jgi:hypothetical protein
MADLPFLFDRIRLERVRSSGNVADSAPLAKPKVQAALQHVEGMIAHAENRLAAVSIVPGRNRCLSLAEELLRIEMLTRETIKRSAEHL